MSLMERSYRTPVNVTVDLKGLRKWLELQAKFFILKHLFGVRNPVLMWNCLIDIFSPFGDNLEDAVIAFHRTLHEEELKHRPR